MHINQIEQEYRYTTPQKCDEVKKVNAISSAATTVSTSASESPLPLSPMNLDASFMSLSHIDDSTIHSLPPKSLRRANLMTLVVDQDYKSPYRVKRTNTWRRKSTRRSDNNDNDDPPPLYMDRVLQLMVKSTDRMLNDAQYDIAKEINREYSLPFDTHSCSEDEEDEEICYEISKVKHTEETFRHELNFAIDKIAYRHASTRDWATEINLIANPTGKVSHTNSSANHYNDQSRSWIEKLLDVFCCNHNFGGTKSSGS